jgi:arylamine N-acetyltransferase
MISVKRADPGRGRAGLLDRVLVTWGVEAPPRPDAAFLDRLHAAYLAHVPFENATKVVKAARVMAPDAAVRGPVEFWEDHLRWGSGGTCFASNYAYQFLLRYLGFPARLLFCGLPAEGPQAHTALAVEAEGHRWLVDVGYALPGIVPLPANGVERRVTPYYDIEIRRGPGNEFLVFSEDARGTRYRYRFHLDGAGDREYVAAWHGTFSLGAPYMRRLALGRFREPLRFLYKDRGRVFEIGREGERTRELEGPEPKAVAGFFALPLPLIEAAFGSLERLRALRAG